MKSFITVVSAFSAVMVKASFDRMEDQFQKLVAKSMNDTIPMNDFRGIGPVSTSLSAINGYGCWCYFADDHGKGHGVAQNRMDEICKILHDGYECAILDGTDENESCEPWTVDYTGSTTLGTSSQDVEIECEAKNTNNCAIRACVIENNFILSVFAEFLSGSLFDPSLKHELGFDPKEECVVPGVPGGDGGDGNDYIKEKACCGSYPKRYPFYHINNHRACCGEKTYSTTTYQCCEEDNEIRYSCI